MWNENCFNSVVHFVTNSFDIYFSHFFFNLSTLSYTEVESKECFVLFEKVQLFFFCFFLFHEEFTFMLRKYMTVGSKNVFFFLQFVVQRTTE